MQDSPLILAVDTAQSSCALALYQESSGLAFSKVEPMSRGQSERLVPLIQESLAATGVGFESLDLLAVNCGPGAFTGLRIGLSAVRAMALALGVPALSVTSLAAFAETYLFENTPGEKEIVAVILETKRADYYVQFFDRAGAPLSPEMALEAKDIGARLKGFSQSVIVGDGALRFESEGLVQKESRVTIKRDRMLADPLALCRLALKQHAKGSEPAFPQPLYLRGADVSVPKTEFRTIKKG